LLARYLNVPELPSREVAPNDVRELVEAFATTVDQSGLKIDHGQLRAFVAGILTKPFAILTGQSGSGKTQLARCLGQWCGRDAAGRDRYAVIPVRPDWTGPEFLFGYEDGLAERVAGHTVWAVPQTLEFILRASGEPGAPYVLILDEMNLAHVERYFADFLSGIESREEIIPSLEQRDSTWVQADGGSRLPLPPNLVVVGTVNIDETTYMFSPKVLDRAFVHEFRVHADELDETLGRPTPVAAGDPEHHAHAVDLLQDDGWHLRNSHPDRAELVDELRRLHEQLANIGSDFGHRVFYEALRFAAIQAAAGVQGADEAIDSIAMTKLLPKIHGSRPRLETTILTMLVWAQGSDPNTPRLPRTHAKLQRMHAVLKDAQFVTFTE
jgi:5-methylcytosine-specific restriction protein B